MAKRQQPTDTPEPAAGIAETAEVETTMPPAEVRGRQTTAPFCPYHKETRCKSNNSAPFFTRYYCPEPGCQFSIKIARPNMARRVAAADSAAEDHSAR